MSPLRDEIPRDRGRDGRRRSRGVVVGESHAVGAWLRGCRTRNGRGSKSSKRIIKMYPRACDISYYITNANEQYIVFINFQTTIYHTTRRAYIVY